MGSAPDFMNSISVISYPQTGPIFHCKRDCFLGGISDQAGVKVT
jgi:hypothetical protein